MLARSVKRKVVVTCGALLGFWLLHEVTTIDLRFAEELADARSSTAVPAPGLRLQFDATAYCRGKVTAAGTAARTGIAAADPALLPVGSVVQIDAGGAKYNGIYTIMDTGPQVHGREVDIYMWDCNEAVQFGRRPVQLRVLRLGWNPQASGRFADVLFKRREQAPRRVSPRATPAPPPDDTAPASLPSRAPTGSAPDRGHGDPVM
jgi:3D (Asp-Asp-Asp) domain-containing protein